MRIPSFLYALYERRLRKQLSDAQIPHHVGIILDGNRRWAKALGVAAASGHKRGADHVSEVLGWCEESGIGIVTLWMLSTENLARAQEELDDLLDIIVRLVESLAQTKRWKLRVIGDMSLLPDAAASRILQAAERSANVDGVTVNVAIGYGGRQEITQAMRDYLLECESRGATLSEVAQNLTTADITNHMYTRGQPDPDLIIRTSGEQRMSGFMLWQTVHTEFFFCETYWPDFRRTDFLRALRDFSRRERRRGK
ncbi:short-chain Z-isoprenyl diphosphate synthase [Arcanobacterium pluranimalium]|uniref:isoprenyl transferase n=1 Tax=Arcanobacterium pluranimalium TaxID=108028 RepID=UPI00195B1BC0|nr:isoprenyl transferase [Arcanobacterium pluranimalium]MBM7824818.1 short-chain Z-isoprenyl diphosphate synthase [Arcanobacterium pluranimalium]